MVETTDSARRSSISGPSANGEAGPSGYYSIRESLVRIYETWKILPPLVKTTGLTLAVLILGSDLPAIRTLLATAPEGDPTQIPTPIVEPTAIIPPTYTPTPYPIEIPAPIVIASDFPNQTVTPRERLDSLTFQPRPVEPTAVENINDPAVKLKKIEEKLKKEGVRDILAIRYLEKNLDVIVDEETTIYTSTSKDSKPAGIKLEKNNSYKMRSDKNPAPIWVLRGDPKGKVESWVLMPEEEEEDVRFILAGGKRVLRSEGWAAFMTGEQEEPNQIAKVYARTVQGR